MAVVWIDGLKNWWSGLGNSSRRDAGQQASSAGGTYTKANALVNTDTAMAVSAVFAATDRYSGAISCMSLQLHDLGPDGEPVSVNRTHDLARLFAHKPYRHLTTPAWLQVVVPNLRLHGNAYCYIQHVREGDPRSRLAGLEPMMSSQMTVVLEEDGSLTYEYEVNGKVYVYSESQILHIRTMGNGVVGFSPLSAAGEHVGLAISARDRASQFARNGFKPSAVLMCEGELSEKQRDSIKSRFKDITEGQNDGLHVLEAGFKYQSLNISPADAQLLESRKFELEEIARFFNISPALIGDKGATGWGSDFESTVEGFYRFSLQPFCELIEAELTAKLLKPEERGTLRFKFNPEDLLKLTPGKLHTTVKEQVQGGLITPNEGRKKLGMAPSEDPNAAFLYMQQQMVRLGTGGGVATPQNGATNNGA